MAHERFSALLPWIVFGVVGRYGGQGTAWAAIGALITAVTLLVIQRDTHGGDPNVLMIGAIVLFAGLAIAAAAYGGPGTWLDINDKVLSAGGFVAVALTSLRFVPFTEFYTRPHTRPSLWGTERFRRVNVTVTLLWAGCGGVVALGHVLATVIDQRAAYTVFNWVVPLAIVMLGAHWADVIWNNYRDETELERDSLWDLTVDLGGSPTRGS